MRDTQCRYPITLVTDMCNANCVRRATRLVTCASMFGSYRLGRCVEHACAIVLPMLVLPRSFRDRASDDVELRTLRTWDTTGKPIACVVDKSIGRNVRKRSMTMSKGW